MDTDREVRDIFFNIERAMRFADPFLKLAQWEQFFCSSL